MKKLVFMFVAVAAISFASCGNQAQQAAPAEADSIEEVVVEDSLAADSAAIDSTAADSAVVAE